MYNRYIPNGGGFTRITEEDDAPPVSQEAQRPQNREPEAPSAPFTPSDPQEAEAPPKEKRSSGLGGILKGLKLEDLDTGDILLLLIILFLFLEGDDIELIITLGLMLLLGLD